MLWVKVAGLLMCVAFANAATRKEMVLTFKNVAVDNVNHATATTQLHTNNFDQRLLRYTAGEAVETSTTAIWTSHATGYPNGTFSNYGTVSFSATDFFSFESASLGHSANCPSVTIDTNATQCGAITYQITGGSGIYEDATGTMVDMFLAPSGQIAFDINVWAVLWIPSRQARPPPAHLQTISVPSLVFPPVKPQAAVKATRHEFALKFVTTTDGTVNHGSVQLGDISLITDLSTPELFFTTVTSHLSADRATWVSKVKQTSAFTFSEEGYVNVTDVGSIVFKSSGDGVSFQGPDQTGFGAITYDIIGGSGAYADAVGLMMDIFVAPSQENSTFEINAWAVFFVPLHK